MDKHSVRIDTKNHIFELDGIPLEKATGAEIEVAPLETKVTFILDDCDIILNSEATVKQIRAESEISETEFTRIIDGIYNYIHHKTLKNGPIKMYPDLKISEYKKMLNL